MASVSVSHMILFIASMIIAAGVAGVFTSSVDDLAGAIEDQGPQVSDQVRTSIDIISDSGSDSIYDDTEENVTLLVKNTGTNTIVPEERQIDVLINGQFTGADDLTVETLGDSDLWRSNDVIRLTVTVDGGLADGDHRAKVIVSGDEDILRFRVNTEAS